MRRSTQFLSLSALAALCLAITPAARADEVPRTITWADLRFPTVEAKRIQIDGAKESVESYNDQIPDKVRELDGKTIELRGYMMPVELEGRDVRLFVLVTSPEVCCYGQTPDVNEYVMVRMTGKPSPLLENIPLRATGTFRVGDIYEHGYWTGLYALECSEVKL